MTSSVKFSEIAELVMGQSPKGADCNETGDGFPLLNGPTEFTERSPLPVQFTTAGKKFSKTGDILFCVRGSTTGRMNYADQAYAIGRGIGAIRGINGYPTAYIRAVLEHNLDRLLVAATGSTFPNVGKDLLNNFEVNVCSPEQAQQANKLLVGIEDKRYLNSQTNQTLEEMAQAIFKSWFVDFDPVKAKINGDKPEGMDEATASLFPEKLVESELGLIPEGWSVEEAKSQLDVLRGFSYKGKGLVGSLDKGVPMHNLNSILEGGGYKYAGLKFYSEEFKEKFAIKEGDVLVANTEQGHNHLLIGYGAMVPKHLAHGFFSHHTYRVRPKKNSNVTPEFIERLFGKGRFVRQVQGFTNGTTVNMLPVAGMEMPQFVVPSKALAQKFSELVKPMKAMIEENHKSNIELAKLRDTLLPKLLSGEIELEPQEAKGE